MANDKNQKLKEFKETLKGTTFEKYISELIIQNPIETTQTISINSLCQTCGITIDNNYCNHCMIFHEEHIFTHCDNHCACNESQTNLEYSKYCSECFIPLTKGIHGTICKNHLNENKCKYDCQYCCLYCNKKHSSREHLCNRCNSKGHPEYLCVVQYSSTSSMMTIDSKTRTKICDTKIKVVNNKTKFKSKKTDNKIKVKETKIKRNVIKTTNYFDVLD